MILEDYNQFPLKWNFRLLWTRDDERNLRLLLLQCFPKRRSGKLMPPVGVEHP